MPHNSRNISSSAAQIGFIEAAVSNISNPFRKYEIRQEGIRPINLRHLPASEAAKVTKHYENIFEKTQLERQAYLAIQLGDSIPPIWGELKHTG